MATTMRRKLLSLITARAAAISVLLGSAVLIQINSPGSFPIDPFVALIGLTFGLTVVYSLTVRQTERRLWLVDVQLIADALIVSAFVSLTGGINSYFSSLYALPIIAGSAIRSWRGGMMVGTVSTAMYAAIVLAQYYGVALLPVDLAPEVLPATRVAFYRFGLNAFGYFAVAGLTGYLAEGLRRADAQLRRASSDLADMQAFSRHIVDSLNSGLTTTDLSGAIFTFNRAAEVITGIPASQAFNRSAADVLQLPRDYTSLFGPPESRPQQTRVEYLYTRPDGKQIELGISAASLMTPRGETGFILTFQDVTESRKLEREARFQQRLAAVGEMAAGIAHEIRNPLASMSGSIQILRQELPLTEEQGQLMDIVLRESERLNDTIRNFLAYARPQRQAMKPVDVRQVITDAGTLLQNSPECGAAHRVAVDVPPDPVWFQADEGQLRQIVWNLATNGLRAMPDGGCLTLAIAPPTDDEPQLVVSVSDDGVGIAPEDLDGIFQPFRGGFSRGSGLGLSIVQRIVSDYGGEVRITSARGSGTTVFVKFPVAAAVAVA